ncbi:uncharacterized protein [Nicotiana sylvestris]|uniref:uncharacterized protein n=1 Tax=Nicotiana sylvestris TaxID=4096 RepID=UPI00388C6C4C
MPLYLKIYDVTTDPEDHIIHYVTATKGNDLSKEQVPSVLLKKFGETLIGGALMWYSQLPACSIAKFEEMTDKFVIAHAGAKKAEARVNDIFAVRQMHANGLRDFLARFNRVRMSFPNVSEGMAVAAFQNGLNRNGSRATRKLLSRLMKYPPTTWEKIHNACCAEIRDNEDDLNGPTQWLMSVQTEASKDHRNDGRRDQSGPRIDRERHQPYIRTSALPPLWHMNAPSRHTIPYRHDKCMPPLLSAHNFYVSTSEIVNALEKLGTKFQALREVVAEEGEWWKFGDEKS